MQRYRKLLSEAGVGATPYSRPNDAALERAGRALAASDVVDVLDELDSLARERDAVPDWDGDTSDDIARRQEVLTRLLAATSGVARQMVLSGAAGREPQTRQYVEIALGWTS
jgi:hypothetical protein